MMKRQGSTGEYSTTCRGWAQGFSESARPSQSRWDLHVPPLNYTAGFVSSLSTFLACVPLCLFVSVYLFCVSFFFLPLKAQFLLSHRGKLERRHNYSLHLGKSFIWWLTAVWFEPPRLCRLLLQGWHFFDIWSIILYISWICLSWKECCISRFFSWGLVPRPCWRPEQPCGATPAFAVSREEAFFTHSCPSDGTKHFGKGLLPSCSLLQLPSGAALRLQWDTDT